MKKLTDDLKHLLAGLASQEAGEFLPIEQKMRVIRIGSASGEPAAAVTRIQNPLPAPRRIAVIVSQCGADEALTCVLEACRRLDAQLDLLYHGPSDTTRVAKLEAWLHRAGVGYRSIDLSDPVATGIEDYVYNHLSLIYLVAAADDPLVKRLVEETPPACRKRLPLPLVLIEGKPAEGFAAAAAL